MKENCANMKVLVDKIKYSQYLWNICADLKVVAILTGLQGGYTNFLCFYVNVTVAKGTNEHYVVKNGSQRKSLTPGIEYQNLWFQVKKFSQKPGTHQKICKSYGQELVRLSVL